MFGTSKRVLTPGILRRANKAEGSSPSPDFGIKRDSSCCHPYYPFLWSPLMGIMGLRLSIRAMSLAIGDLNDFLSPSQVCIKPVSETKSPKDAENNVPAVS